MSLPAESLAPRVFEDVLHIGDRVVPIRLKEQSWEKSSEFKKLCDRIEVVTYEKYCQFIVEVDGKAELSTEEAIVEIECIATRRNAIVSALATVVKPIDASQELSGSDLQSVPYRVLRNLLQKQIELDGRVEILGELYGLLDRVTKAVTTSSMTPTSAANES